MKLPKGDVAAWMRAVLTPGDTFIDGGANVGNVSKLAAKLVGEGGRVYAVEPDPRCHQSLDNLAAEASQITVIKAALATQRGTVPFHRADRCEQNSVIERAVSSKLDCIDVPTLLLDEVCPTGAVKAVKLDLQGSEPHAILGASSLLARCPNWCLEFWPHALGKRADFLLWAFANMGFVAKSMDPGYPVVPMSDLLRWCLEEHSATHHVNVVFAPEWRKNEDFAQV